MQGKNKSRRPSEKQFSLEYSNAIEDISHLRVRYIVTHLFTQYGQVENQDLIGNRAKLSEIWDANRPFQELVQQVQEIK